MTSTRSASDPDHVALGTPALYELEAGTQALARRLAQARASHAPDSEVLLADLEVAQEELRVAGEEVRTQHEAICQLTASHRSLRAQQERTMGILPVPAFVTDMHGTITSVNGAAAAMLHTRVEHLLGKPMVGLFALDDRPDVRRLISRQHHAVDDGRVIRRAVTLLERRGGPALVELTGSVQLVPAGRKEIAWFLLSSQDTFPAADLAECLTRLATLPHHTTDLRSVLASAAAACAEVLDAHVTIALGVPSAPEAVGSSSQLAQACDGAQLSTSDGPSFAAYRSGSTVVSTMLVEDERWPTLAAHLPQGLGPAVAAPLVPQDEVAGTLTAYGPRSASLAHESVRILAQTVSGVVQELQLISELGALRADMERALATRGVIEQAKGIIMAVRHVDADAAWEHLLSLSSAQERKVREVAQDIVARSASQGRDPREAQPG